MKKSTNARILAAVTALFFPVAALADEAGESPEVAVELVVIEESEGDMEAVIVGESLAETEGAAGQDLGKWSNYAQPGDLAAAPAAGDAAGTPHLNRTKRFFLSIGSTIGSVLYFPVKLVVGVTGAWVGGIAGALSGGDQATAAGIWNVTTDGDYFVSPEELDHTREFRLTGDHR